MIWIVDFGSQYTGLIGKAYSKIGIASRIVAPSDVIGAGFAADAANGAANPKGIVLSGSPRTVGAGDLEWAEAFFSNSSLTGVPVLGICFGFQLIAARFGGALRAGIDREYGDTEVALNDAGKSHPLFRSVPERIRTWMSHGNSVTSSARMAPLATSEETLSAFEIPVENLYAVLFHPEVTHSEFGQEVLGNFATQICKLSPERRFGQDWDAFMNAAAAEYSSLGKVLCAVSGGVDSTVLAVLLSRFAEVHAVYVDHGFQRAYDLPDLQAVFRNYPKIKLHVLNEQDRFFSRMTGISDPECKRKAMGAAFIDAFRDHAATLETGYFAQGTIASDVVESGSNRAATAQKIKSHHNVGGLPPDLPFTLIEPLRSLFKDQVRSLGLHLGIPKAFIDRHPFPGPGLSIRCLGAIERGRIEKLRQADEIFHRELRSRGLYDRTWQAGVVLLPVRSTGVMGDESSLEECLAIRMVDSTDAMTAEATEIPWRELKEIASCIVNKVRGINRVVYDLTSKPPATIEWE